MEQRSIAHLVPKVELHCHLTGSVTPAAMAEMARSCGLSGIATDEAEISRNLWVEEECPNLESYLERFAFVARYFATPASIAFATRSVVRDMARQNVIRLELRFSPVLLQRYNELDFDAIIGIVTDAIREEAAACGISADGIVIMGRDKPLETNLEVVRAAGRFLGRGVVGVDVAGAEARYPPETQEEPLRLARQLGLPITLHAGEDGDPINIETAAFRLGARRIGHGTNIHQLPGLLERLIAQGVGVEMCPTSNYLTKAISGWDDYHIRDYFDSGLKIAVCGDDPAMSNIDLTHEYRLMEERYSFTLPNFERMVLDALDISFLQDGERARLKLLAGSQFAALKQS